MRYSEDQPAPYSVLLHPRAIILMEIQSHLSKEEVVGILAGTFDAEKKELLVERALPCQCSVEGAGYQLETSSQTKLRKYFNKNQNLELIGWYTSHGSLSCTPSIRDIATQARFQEMFPKEKRSCPDLIGIIMSPFHFDSVQSAFSVMNLSQRSDPSGSYRLPYQLDWRVIEPPAMQLTALRTEIQNQVKKLSRQPTIDLRLPYKTSDISLKQKLITAVISRLTAPEEAIEAFRAVLERELDECLLRSREEAIVDVT